MVRVLFLHPDLGIGGAERLVVDAAIALKQRGHYVSFLTNHHDPQHCFEETRNGSLPVVTVGDWLPRNIFGKFSALCAYIRMIYAAMYAVLASNEPAYDVIFCDQISLGIPILRLAPKRPKILFYCHFPDQLLSAPGSVLKHYYRLLLNSMEERTTGSADGILVNSKFTRRTFKETFRSLKSMPSVLYPSLNTAYFDACETANDGLSKVIPEFSSSSLPADPIVFLSINRFDRKKNLPLALRAFKLLETKLTKMEWASCRLIMAGGYDERVLENVEHFDELDELVDELKLRQEVVLLKSPSDQRKVELLQRCEALLYTPENEHFGIVPLESMYLRRPVIAVNSGGPTETIIHESTGFLCANDETEFADAMVRFVKDRTLFVRMGERGRKRVQQKFSFEAFTDQLDTIVRELVDDGGPKRNKNN